MHWLLYCLLLFFDTPPPLSSPLQNPL